MKPRYTGEEYLHVGDKKLPFYINEFWSITLSDILFNMNRGTFAEFIVRCSLVQNGFPAFEQSNGSARSFDITGPTIPSCNRPSRIEVKSTASIQSNTPDKSEPLHLPDTKLCFNIRPSTDWDNPEAGARRNNDLYVFCHYKATSKDDDILDLNFWDFYVYPTFKIEESPVLSKQKSVSIYRLKKLSVSPLPFEKVYNEILNCISEISEYEKAKV